MITEITKGIIDLAQLAKNIKIAKMIKKEVKSYAI